MNLDRVGSGKNLPDDINVIIEIPSHSDPVKYEVDKETGALFVDVLGLVISVWKVVLNPGSVTKLEPVTSSDRQPDTSGR